MATFSDSSFVWWFLFLALGLQFTPTVRPRSRTIPLLTIVSGLVFQVAALLRSTHLDHPYDDLVSPWAVAGLAGPISVLASVAIVVLGLCLLADAYVLVAAFRRARGGLGRQLLWLLAGATPLPLGSTCNHLVDQTMYVAWNAMFVSAYLDAGNTPDGFVAEESRRFALKTLDRLLSEVWSEARGFGHRLGGPPLEGSLDDQIFGVLALLDAFETTLDARYFTAAQKTMGASPLLSTAMPKAAAFSIARTMRRRWAASKFVANRFRIRQLPAQIPSRRSRSSACTRHGEARYFTFAQKTLEAFAGIAPQYGMFAATYGLAATLIRASSDANCRHRSANDRVRNRWKRRSSVYRFGKAVLRVTSGMDTSTFSRGVA